jgi:hypothetical protein
MASPHSVAKSSAMREQMMHECMAMIRYALASGMSVPPALVDTVEKARFEPDNKPMDMAPIVKAHQQLSKLIAPATPRALLAMGDEHGGRVTWLGSVGLVRRMMGASIVSVILFIALSLSPYITSARVSPENSDGLPLLMNELFWMAAAGIGASFAMLMQVNDFIVKRTYDPKYEPTYWIKFILGVMAGFILAAMIPLGGPGGQGPNATVTALAVPTLAMLGGFSASAVYRILTKLVESIEGVFRGSPREEAAQREKAVQVRASEEVSQTRLNVAGQIVRLQQQVAAGADGAAMAGSLQELLDSLVPDRSQQGENGDGSQQQGGPATISLPNIPVVATPASSGTGADVSSGDSPSPASGDGDAPAATASTEATAETANGESQPAAVG